MHVDKAPIRYATRLSRLRSITTQEQCAALLHSIAVKIAPDVRSLPRAPDRPTPARLRPHLAPCTVPRHMDLGIDYQYRAGVTCTHPDRLTNGGPGLQRRRPGYAAHARGYGNDAGFLGPIRPDSAGRADRGLCPSRKQTLSHQDVRGLPRRVAAPTAGTPGRRSRRSRCRGRWRPRG